MVVACDGEVQDHRARLADGAFWRGLSSLGGWSRTDVNAGEHARKHKGQYCNQNDTKVSRK